MSEHIQASIDHLRYAQNGGALRARFRDGVTGSWVQGWLVGWVQSSYPWVCCEDEPDCFDWHYDDAVHYQYCEILTSDLGAR